MPTPYAEHVGDRDPVDVLRISLADYRAVRARITPELWSRPLAPGKWTLHQVMVHVMQWEMIFGIRVRCGLAVPDYVVQPLDQDPFMAEASAVDGPTAAATFDALRQTNLLLAASLTAEARRRPVRHPERGQIDVNDLLVTLAGHGVHHLKQLQSVV
jgi:hypothetical protein